MAEKMPQTYANHKRLVPGFHIVAFGLLVINLLWSLYRVVFAFSLQNLVTTLLAVGVVLLFVYARTFVTIVQDRIIRLEERLRLRSVLPDDLKRSVDDLTPAQQIALRFGSDNEVVELVRVVRSEGITDREEIKRRVKNWRPDYLRV